MRPGRQRRRQRSQPHHLTVHQDLGAARERLEHGHADVRRGTRFLPVRASRDADRQHDGDNRRPSATIARSWDRWSRTRPASSCPSASAEQRDRSGDYARTLFLLGLGFERLECLDGRGRLEQRHVGRPDVLGHAPKFERTNRRGFDWWQRRNGYDRDDGRWRRDDRNGPDRDRGRRGRGRRPRHRHVERRRADGDRGRTIVPPLPATSNPADRRARSRHEVLPCAFPRPRGRRRRPRTPRRRPRRAPDRDSCGSDPRKQPARIPRRPGRSSSCGCRIWFSQAGCDDVGGGGAASGSLSCGIVRARISVPDWSRRRESSSPSSASGSNTGSSTRSGERRSRAASASAHEAADNNSWSSSSRARHASAACCRCSGSTARMSAI